MFLGVHEELFFFNQSRSSCSSLRERRSPRKLSPKQPTSIIVLFLALPEITKESFFDDLDHLAFKKFHMMILVPVHHVPHHVQDLNEPFLVAAIQGSKTNVFFSMTSCFSLSLIIVIDTITAASWFHWWQNDKLEAMD